MGCSLLVANQNMPHLLLGIQGIIDVQRRAPGLTENNIDAFIFQALNDDLSAGQFHI